MKKYAVALFALLLGACADLTAPAPADPAPSPAAESSDADAAAILAVAMTDPLFTSGRMNTVGVLSAGRSAHSATVLFTNGTSKVRRAYRRTGLTWSPDASAGPLLSMTPAEGGIADVSYSPVIAKVFRLDASLNTVLWQSLYAQGINESGDYVTGSSVDEDQRLWRGEFYAGTETVNGTTVTVDAFQYMKYYHRVTSVSSHEGTCVNTVCNLYFDPGSNNVLVGSRYVAFYYHLRVRKPVTISAITGNSHVPYTGDYTWSVSADGGDNADPAMTYEWQISYNGGASWSALGTQKNQTLSFTSTSTAPFTLRARASRSGLTSAWVSKSVTVASSLYAPLQVYPVGETVITTQDTYTYYPGVSGGNGTYTYQWHIIWDGAPYHTDGPLGTGASQDISVVPGDGNFTLRVDVTSNGQTVVGYKYVTNHMTCGEDYCPVEGN